MEQRIVLLYDVSIDASLQRAASQAGFESAPIAELEIALNKLSVADARWKCLSAEDQTIENLSLLLTGIREIPVSMRPYVILVSGVRVPWGSMPEGIDEIIELPISPSDLMAKLRPSRRFIRLQTEFRRQALRDPLTTVLNRRAVLDMLERELVRARRLATPVSLAMVDLDNYKAVNDELGHLAGDAALVALASRLQSQLRPYDAVGRYGGDEFLVLLTNCALPQAQLICDRMRSAVHAAPFTIGSATVAMTISVGLTCLEPSEHSDATGMIARADVALYRAKNAGRNRVVIAT